ncbi:uncharacterized protein VTP21DRAFT_717 [Calcarisporiella thermophila]|uniref:uncharacterized protein n=1 Tax=Calcarisporiella thermophila TaxID=911321 RepID=UPI003743C27F
MKSKRYLTLQISVFVIGIILLCNFIFNGEWDEWIGYFRANHLTQCDTGNCPPSTSTDVPKQSLTPLDGAEVKGENEHNSNAVEQNENTFADEKLKDDGWAFTIVSAASVGHFCELEAFIYTLYDVTSQLPDGERPRVIIYDLGLHPRQVEVLKNLQQHGRIQEYVLFDFSRYPAFWNPVVTPRGEYAWKSGIIFEMTQRFGGRVVWMDAGDRAQLSFFKWIPGYLQKYGFWSARSSGTMKQWVHPGMFAYYHENPGKYAKNPNCNGAALAFDASNTTIMDQLLRPWVACSHEHACIAPEGSSRENHRQDQAALTLLATKMGYLCEDTPQHHGIMTHQDALCRQRLNEYREMDKLYIPSTLTLPKWTQLEREMQRKLAAQKEIETNKEGQVTESTGNEYTITNEPPVRKTRRKKRSRKPQSVS